ncbi:hypothetical protein [Nodularia sp. UHCC 0506]|uniref:hypothetical protein n=1 Tax=Nodularia sp. UHCC 0506 TaxID=3110243 RepID=UPI002B221216|nr:hypothetical protein [Nodularia sp. UHCC 0506]MEA5517091.1 hypothetical protein [Nodularia sp. UHCC 0506]
MSLASSDPNSIDEFFKRFESVLLQTWQDTGYGHLEIDSERINQDKIRVILRGSTHYRYVISDEDLKNRTSTEN